jgi:hypothetical protein
MRSALLTVFLGLLGTGSALGQTFAFEPSSLWEEETAAPAYSQLALLSFADAPDYSGLRGAREPRLFRMPSRWLDDNTDLDPGASAPAAPDDPSDDDGRFQVVVGAHNPLLDFRRSGDYGGLGYQRFATQMILAGDDTTTIHLNVEAVTPAGPECFGLTRGPTVVFPSLCGYHDLGDGSTLIGFVGKPARATVESFEGLNSNIRYGVAFQQPLLDPLPSARQQVYFVLEALGRYRIASDLGALPPGGWEIIPGIHWSASERCWVSSGWLVPVGGSRADSGVWQITCSWRF